MNNTPTKATSSEDAEIDKYIAMLSKQGYGHDLSDQRKRVKAGCIIARHLYKAEKEKDKAVIDKAVDIVKTCKFWFDNEANYPEGTAGYRVAQQCKEVLLLLSSIEKDIW